MEPLTVIFVSPESNLLFRICQCTEPTGVQTFIAEPAIEAFHMTVLHRLSWLYMNQVDLLLLAPAQDVAAGQFRAIVASDNFGGSSLLNNAVERACHAATMVRTRMPRPVPIVSAKKSSAHSSFCRTCKARLAAGRLSRFRFRRRTANPLHCKGDTAA